jgi:ubiquinone/menaquinone biosynthesis C-methylase UbiE
VQAKRGVNSFACDGNDHLINNLRELHLDQLFGGYVDYSFQDLTKTSYPDSQFDAISCVSVLEHIPAPYDKNAVLELQRILKPGGYLILTVDFTPTIDHLGQSRLKYYFDRAYRLARNGEYSEVINAIKRKYLAQRAVAQGEAKHLRSANQCFEASHLEDDIIPLLIGEEIESRLVFPKDPYSIKPSDAVRFWSLEGKENASYERKVLPAGLIIQKPIK